MLPYLLAVAAMMKMQPLTLCIFATVFISCASSLVAGNDELGSLVGPKAGEKSLEKKKPPPNVPGPKLTLGNLHFSPLVGIQEHQEMTKKLNPDQGRKKQAEATRSKKNPLTGPQGPQGPPRTDSSRITKGKINGEGRTWISPNGSGTRGIILRERIQIRTRVPTYDF